MDIKKIVETIIPKVNSDTLAELGSIGFGLIDIEDTYLNEELENAFLELGGDGVDHDQVIAITLFLIGKELGKQEAIKNQKIFVQGDY